MKKATLNYFVTAMDPPRIVIHPERLGMISTDRNNLKIPMLHIFFEAEDFGHRSIDENGEWDGVSWNYDVDNLEGEEDYSRVLLWGAV
jgi:hypothetical protein